MCIQTFVPQTPIERFHKGIVGGLARAREVQFYFILIGPAIQHFRDELRAIVHSNGARGSSDRRDPCHRLYNLLSLDTLRNINCERFSGKSIDDGQRPKSTDVTP